MTFRLHLSGATHQTLPLVPHNSIRGLVIRERERGTCSTVAVVSHSLAAFGTNFGGRRLSVVSLSSFEVNANALLTAHGAVSVPLPSLSALAKWG